MELESILKMLDKAINFGIQEVDLSGGEPLTTGKSSILPIIQYSSRRDLVTTINTNAWFLDEEYISNLKDAGLDRIKFSLYGTSARSHEDFTGTKGSFKKIIGALGFLKNNGIETWIHYVVTPKNLPETFCLPDLIDPYEVDTIQLSSIIPTGRGKNAEAYRFRDHELPLVIKELETAFTDLINEKIFFTIALYPTLDAYPFKDRYCDYLIDRIVVDPSGHVIPCCIMPEEIRSKKGNVIKEDIRDIYTSREMERDTIFYWIKRGHKAMSEALKHPKRSNNLCSTCIEMLIALKGQQIPDIDPTMSSNEN